MKLPPFPGRLTEQTVCRPFTRKTGCHGTIHTKAVVLTDEQREWLARWFPEMPNALLLKASGMSHSTMHRFARELGLVKSEKGRRRIIRYQAKICKQVNEANGYYDSLRGRPCSEATRQGTAQMWQDIREGRREHPFAIMKRRSPARYRKYMQRKSEERRETIRKETRRMLYGLERQTRLKCIVLRPYTKRQTSHRYNALKRGYIVMADCSEQSGERYNIYYDQDTQRAPLFEKHLVEDGFAIKPLEPEVTTTDLTDETDGLENNEEE